MDEYLALTFGLMEIIDNHNIPTIVGIRRYPSCRKYNPTVVCKMRWWVEREEIGVWFPCSCQLFVWIGYHGIVAFHVVDMSVLCSELGLSFRLWILCEPNHVSHFLYRALHREIVLLSAYLTSCWWQTDTAFIDWF